MKKLIISVFLFISSLGIFAAEPVEVSIIDGIYNESVKKKMESSMSKVLTEINAAQEENRLPRYASMGLNSTVQGKLSMLWETCPFQCSDSEIAEHCIKLSNGFQVRNIPLLMKPSDETKLADDEVYQEFTFNFDKNGNIIDMQLSISMNLYKKIIDSNIEVTDMRRRQLIVDYVDQFKTSYNLKDIKFLRQVFSDDALIIVGRTIKQTKDGIALPDKIEYTKYSKSEYLTNLERAFKSNRTISVKFEDIKLMRHPINPDFYGVTVKQTWRSDRYHDEGYVFMLWDFENEKEPKIHVRTWQPGMFNGKELPQDDVFDIFDFTIGKKSQK